MLFAYDAANDGKEFICLLRREDRGRLVEYQDVRAPVECLEYFNALLNADAYVFNSGRRVHCKAVLLYQFARYLLSTAVIKKYTCAARLAAHDDILCHGEAGHQHEVLVNHAYAVGYCVLGAMLLHLLSTHENFAVGRRIYAVYNVHQSGFSRAVLSHERKHLAPVYLERYIVVGQDAGKFLGYV